MAIAAPPGRRRPRFERAPERVALQLTSRDEDMIRFIAERRFVTSRHIQAAIPGSAKALLARLHGLYHAGYIDRPRAQLDYYSKVGSSPMVYALADRGARHLNARFASSFADADWGPRNRSVGRPFIEHALAITDFHVALLSRRQGHPDVELISERALVTAFPSPPTSPDRAFSWQTHVYHNGVSHMVTVKPDYAFGLRSPTIARRCYLVEIDRSTMPLQRDDIQQTSIYRKFAAYLQGYSDRLHDRQFGWKACRILFVTNSAERVRNMQIVLRKTTEAANLRRVFYFAQADDLKSDIFTHRWIDGNGEPQTLI